MGTSKSKVLATSEIEIAYREFGLPDGLPVLMLHGFPEGAASFDGLIERLDLEGLRLRVIVPSVRGCGATMVTKEDLISGEVAAWAHDVFALADGLGLERFVIVGHDWGARGGYGACVLQPERVIGHFALASPYEMFGGEMPPEQADAYWYQWYFQTALGKKALEENAEALCHHIWERWSPSWGFSRKEFAASAADWKNPQFAEIVLHAYRHRWGNALGKPAYAEAQAKLDAKPKPRIGVRTMFVYGGDDHCVLPAASEGQKSLFSGEYERVAIKGVGHFPQMEDPKAVAKLFERFLKSLR